MATGFTWLRAALTGAILALAGIAAADAVITLTGKRVEGDIVFESDTEIRLRTQDYGELRFRKMDLQTVIRGSGAQAPGSGFGAPMGGGTSGGGTNPFGGGASDPFGSGAGNPFGGGAADDPFGGGGSNPFASNPATTTGATAASTAATTALPEFEPDAPMPPPAVPFGWDGVVYGVPEGGEILVRTSGEQGAALSPATGDTNLRVGAEIQTQESRARVVLKNGRDVVRLPRRTHVELVELDEQNVTIELKRGRLWCEVDPTASRTQFQVRTPNVVAGVQGTIFRVSDELDQGVNIAVLEGAVSVASRKAQITVTVPADKMVLVTPDGTISAIIDLPEAIRSEYVSWEQWADESIASLGMIGGGAADAMIRDIAASNAQWGAAMQEGNYYVSLNKLGDYLREVGDAFRSFAADTGHAPTAEDGFSILVQNSGNWPGWKGPYWQGALPPLDAWRRPLRYTMRESAASGNTVGVVYSMGSDNIDNGGSTASDIVELILYNQIEAIRTNPEYDPATVKARLEAEREGATGTRRRR